MLVQAGHARNLSVEELLKDLCTLTNSEPIWLIAN